MKTSGIVAPISFEDIEITMKISDKTSIPHCFFTSPESALSEGETVL